MRTAKRYFKLAVLCLPAILGVVVGQSALASAFPTVCNTLSPPLSPTQGCDDVTGSLGEIIVWVSDGPNVGGVNTGAWRNTLSSIPPQWNNPLPNHWTSSVMEDFATRIGRSVVFPESGPLDQNGVAVGLALTNVGDSSFPFMPWTDGPAGTNEIHTELRSMDLVGGFCPCGNTQSPLQLHVRGGVGAGVLTPSYGEVEALSNLSDFPARSFFDVFVEVEIPGPLPFGMKVANPPTDPLIVSDTNLMTLPPRVVYIHSGQTNAVPVYVTTGPYAGQLFGFLRLAGHMPNGFCGPRPLAASPTVDCTDADFLIRSVAEAPLMICPGCNDLCVGQANGTACSDSDACTQNDVCQNGACIGVPTVCNDGNGCTIDTCDPATGQCAYTPKDCNDNLVCTTDFCDPTGNCGHTPVDCNDNDPCTDDLCDPVSGCFHPPHDCDDGNACTDDLCVPETGCVFTSNNATCDDGNFCTTGDTCSGGTCQPGTPVDCNDGNVCTTDGCFPRTGCTYVDNTNPCDDGNACTIEDACLGGTCHPGVPFACNDNNVCTADTCDPTSGCVYTNITGPCDDGNACTTGEVCVAGTCQLGVGVACTPSDQCHLAGICDPGTGLCSNPTAPNGTTCSDGNPCTLGDRCVGGVCAGVTTITTPAETHNLAAAADKSTYTWSEASDATAYDAVRGDVAALPVGSSAGGEVCFENLSAPALVDAATPAPHAGFWYLSRARNPCGPGPIGAQSNGTMRVTTACP